MAIYSSVDSVLSAIAYKVKVYNDVLKDPVAKQILSHSPPAPRKQYLSRSLDIAESKMAAATSEKSKEPTPQQQEAEKRLKMAAEEAAKVAAKQVKFDKAQSAFEFSAAAVKTQEPEPCKSLLAEIIKSLPAPAKTDISGATRAEIVEVKVFLPEGGPLQVKVAKVATVGELIWSTIQQYEEEKRQPPLVALTRAYLLKMAEEDGTPEDMILKPADKYYNFGLFFALVPNPNYDHGGSTSGSREALSRSSGPSDKGKPERSTLRKGMGTFRSKGKFSSDSNDALEAEFLKIKMPDGSHTTVRLPDTALASEVLEKCCSKRKFDPDQFHLEFIEDQEEVPESLTVAQLKERAVELVANSAVAGLDTYMSDTKAMQYEVFKVVKMKKGLGNKMQERLLGIDYDRITNQVPEEQLRQRNGVKSTMDAFRGRGTGVKNDYWLMTDLVEAVQDPEKNKQFVLTIRDAQNRDKLLTYRYEAETPKMAKQVVQKLSRLLELNNRFVK